MIGAAASAATAVCAGMSVWLKRQIVVNTRIAVGSGKASIGPDHP
jgi:hypothetical protein